MKTIEAFINEYQQIKEKMQTLEQENSDLKHKLELSDKQVQDRFKEIAALTKMIEERDAVLLESSHPTKPESLDLESIAKVSSADAVNLISESGVFDLNFYLSEYSDIAASEMNPVEHYVLFGAQERRNPSKQFNTENYYRQHPRLEGMKINPLLHYIKSKELVT